MYFILIGSAVAVLTSLPQYLTLKTSSTTQANVVTQLSNQQQSISGVNLDEEYGNLQLFQQYYLANAQVLQTASTLFDALINIR